MKISLNWIAEYVDLSAHTPHEIAELLTLHTAEVEGVEEFGNHISDVLIGEVVECGKHPDADKLSLTKVNYGADELAQVICGAANVRAGLKVAFAPVGAHLPGGLEIKKAKLRGVESFGMICSEKELELGDSHDGILELEETAEVGASFVETYGIQDTVLELDNKAITHRPDLWGHYGFARELAAILGQELKPLALFSDWPANQWDGEIKVQDAHDCPVYSAASYLLTGGPKQASWRIRRRLLAVGQRPVHDLVDLTNYVQLEIGQPTHAFDKGNLSANEIAVIRLDSEFLFTTLDGEVQNLESGDIVISSGGKTIALAGIMGGEDSQIQAETREVVLESACFHPIRVRRTAQRLALRTESSSRFEKSLDPALALQAQARFAHLLLEERPDAEVSSAPRVVQAEPQPILEMDLDVARVNQKLGLELNGEEMAASLSRLGFSCSVHDLTIRIQVPTWRATKDIQIPADLEEEIGRLHGYHRIRARAIEVPMVAAPLQPSRVLERALADRFCGSYGGSQTQGYSFLSEAWVSRLGNPESDYVPILNPVQDSWRYLRLDLLPSLLEQACGNLRDQEAGFLFEIGKGYFPNQGSLPLEKRLCGGILWDETNNVLQGPASLFGKIRSMIAEAIGQVAKVKFKFSVPDQGALAYENPTRLLVAVHSSGVELGRLFVVHPQIRAELGASETQLLGFSIDLGACLDFQSEGTHFKAPSKYPPTKVDIALAIPSAVSFQDTESAIRSSAGKWLAKLQLFDVFEGPPLEAGMKSFAFHALLQAKDRTLSEKEEQQFLTKVNQVAKDLGGKLRQ